MLNLCISDVRWLLNLLNGLLLGFPHDTDNGKHIYAPRIGRVDIAALPLLFEVFGDHWRPLETTPHSIARWRGNF